MILILTTFNNKDKEKAGEIAKELLKQKLAGCVLALPTISFFWWEGKLENPAEILMVIKTRENLFKKVKEFLERRHPYRIPFIARFKIQEVNKAYEDWLESAVAGL